MKRITIDKKEYTIEYSIEATLYNECIEKVMDLMVSAGVTEAEISNEETSAKEKVGVIANTFTKNVADIPQKALTLFYAGLLEHHGEFGDKTVRSIYEAKGLMIAYMKENEGLTLYDIMNDMIDEMGKDHFFEKIGVDKMVRNANEKAEKELKKPEDHKKKSKVGDN